MRLTGTPARSLLLVVVFAPGCGWDALNGEQGGTCALHGVTADGGVGGDTMAVSLADYPSELTKALCSALIACGEAIDQQTCQGGSSTNGQALFAAAMRGTVIYDPFAAGACLEGWASLGCNFQANPEVCSRTFRGRVPPGGVCVLNEECEDHGLCVYDSRTCSADGGCCAGTCVARPGPIPMGCACGANSRCSSGTSCKGNPATCVALPKGGESCVPGVDCSPPYTCFLTSDTRGICALPAAEGESCAATSCQDRRHFCDVVTRTCTKKKLPGADCQDHSRPGDLQGPRECVGYARCLGGTCVPDGRIGDSCAANIDCGTRHCDANICAARPPDVACLPRA